MQPKVLTPSEIMEKLATQKNPSHQGYFAFYSSWFGGITKEPHLMLVPVDDHQVHRGDAVFEALKAVDRRVFLMNSHLNRLEKSAESIGLKLPFSKQEIAEILLETLRASEQSQAVIRLFVSRGPGSFSPNPYDSVGSQLYIAITELKPLSPAKYEAGASLGFSKIPVKDSWMAKVKSCNYLPNVMMKKESVDRGLDFSIGIDNSGSISEGPTENLVILDSSGTLVHPTLENILHGTTMKRVFELAAELKIPTASRPLKPEDLWNAREVMMMGTTIDVLPVTTVEGRNVGSGKPGEISKKLGDRLASDMKSGPDSTSY